MESLKSLLKNLAEQGVFGEAELLGIHEDDDKEIAVQLNSEIKFFKLHLQEKGIIKELPVTVKVQLKDHPRIADCRTDLQFANEVAMYGRILPELGACEIGVTPKMLYASIAEGRSFERDIIVLEDLRSSGYKIAEHLSFDYDHVALTLRKLGEYHGLSYKMKQAFPEKLRKLCALLHPRKYKLVEGLVDGALYRGFAPIMDNKLAKIAHEKLVSSVYKNQEGIIDAEEPFAAISHGDFNRNNLLYAYDEYGKVSKVKFVDFAFPYYTDPAYDIAFFLYMNTSDEMRRKHWDDFLVIYWRGVTSVMADPGFGFEQFLKNFAKRAIWGYCPCCFWLPLMMFPDLLKERDQLNGSVEEKRAFGMSAGGEEVSKAVCDITRHLLDMGYLEDFVKNY